MSSIAFSRLVPTEFIVLQWWHSHQKGGFVVKNGGCLQCLQTGCSIFSSPKSLKCLQQVRIGVGLAAIPADPAPVHRLDWLPLVLPEGHHGWDAALFGELPKLFHRPDFRASLENPIEDEVAEVNVSVGGMRILKEVLSVSGNAIKEVNQGSKLMRIECRPNCPGHGEGTDPTDRWRAQNTPIEVNVMADDIACVSRESGMGAR
jgi:hypothetical protein